MDYGDFDEEYDEIDADCRCENCELCRKYYSSLNRKERRRLSKEILRTLKNSYLFHIGFSIIEMDENTEIEENMNELKTRNDT